AEVPPTWECRLHGAESKIIDGVEPEAKKTKPPRTHWDMLLERRSIPELEELLDERLEELRGRRTRTA
ncbi:MAG TPA: RNA polymerase-binding protein RbpA, partial [Pseudonocardiaceae bacterium]|nr:RNA polymerase-binding protein RbpA [Pseudonocardiaceae bacterium]